MSETIPTTLIIRDESLSEDLTLQVTDRPTAERLVDAIVEAAEQGQSVRLWKGGEEFSFVSPDIILGPTFGIDRLNIEATFAGE